MLATTSQPAAAAPAPSGTIHSFFMGTSHDSALGCRGRPVSPVRVDGGQDTPAPGTGRARVDELLRRGGP